MLPITLGALFNFIKMCSLSEMAKRVEIVHQSIIHFTSITIQQVEEEFEIIQLNKNQLYELGIDSKDVKLAPYRSNYYATMKFELRGKELTDLFLSGEFQRNFYIFVVGNSQYGISSTDSKTNELIEKYGEQIFGLTVENKLKAFAILKPSLVEKVNEVLKCNII